MSDRFHRLQQFVGRHAGSVILCSAGVVLILFSLVVYALREGPEALGFTLFGVACLAIGASLPRLTEAEVSAQKLNFKLEAPSERAETVALSLAETVPDEQFDEPSELVVAARWYLGGEALAQVLTPGPSSPINGALVRLYLYDSDKNRLVPVLFSGEEAGESSTEEWEIGRGATGTAYARGDVVLAEGEAVSDTTYGLTEEQSRRFRHLTAVMSAPVANADGDVIGVITASTTRRGGDGLVTEDGYLDVVTRSMLVARILVDLLGWFPDRYPDVDGE